MKQRSNRPDTSAQPGHAPRVPIEWIAYYCHLHHQWVPYYVLDFLNHGCDRGHIALRWRQFMEV